MSCCVRSKSKNHLLKSQNIYLRKLQSIDIDLILKWENDIENWEVTGTTKSFTKEEITKFVNGNHDLSLNEQIRYVICLNSNNKAVGTIDLFEYDVQNKTIGVGVLIAETKDRKKGYASEAVNIISDYCRLHNWRMTSKCFEKTHN